MKEFTIGTNDAGQRLDRFLAKAVPLLPASLAQKYIRLTWRKTVIVSEESGPILYPVKTCPECASFLLLLRAGGRISEAFSGNI